MFKMAKRKQPRKNKTSTIKQAKATTPTKTISGKVVKKRVDVKTIKATEKNLKVNSNDKQYSKGLREFSIRLRRTSANSKNNLQKSETNEQKHENINKVYKTESNHTIIKSKRKAISTKLEKNSSNSIVDKPILNIKDSNDVQKNKSRTRSNKRHQTQNFIDYQIPVQTRRCVIKLQKIPTVKTATTVVGTTDPTPCIKRKCAVRLPKTLGRVETGQICAKSSNRIDEAKNSDEIPDKIADTDSVSSNPLKVPAIDNSMRENFRKLSLAKPLNILEDWKTSSKGAEFANQSINEETQSCEQNVLNNNRHSKIRQISKLSLKRPFRESDKVVIDSQLEPHSESSIPFNPKRNSTLLELDSTKDKKQKSLSEETKKLSSFQNYANKSNEIENLLNSLENEEEILLSSAETNEINNKTSSNNSRDEHEEIRSNITNDKNKTNKFFHNKKQNDRIKNLEKISKTPEVAEKRKLCIRRSTRAKRANVYDFFSQSQTSDSDSAKHVDPTADIVKKLIEEGKVQVATNCKGKGKPKLKPQIRPKNKIKQTAAKKLNQLNTTKQRKKVKFVESQYNDVEDCFDDDHFNAEHFTNDGLDNDEQFIVNHSHEMEIQKPNISGSLNIQNIKSLVNDQEGTFSPLARTVLLHQTDRSNSKRKLQSELLEKVRSLISTPKNKKSASPHTGLQTDLSPIAVLPSRAIQPKSPWRVNEDAYLPKTFNFSTSSGNLPSFSSDFIPSTPRKEKSRKYLSEINQKGITCDKSPSLGLINSNIENMPRQIANSNEPSSISSFSSNDSNAENVPPPKSTFNDCNENERIFELKQVPNPRRSLKNRSPLKSINILQVLHLPPYKKPDKTKISDDFAADQEKLSSFEENQGNHSNEEAFSVQSLNDNTENLRKEDLFGFEEYLSQSDIFSQQNDKFDNNKTREEQNQSIKDKLHCLQKFKPPENDLQKSLKQNSKYTIKNLPIFDDAPVKDYGVRQRGIKEMMCSTMLDVQPSTSKEALNRLNKNNLRNIKRPNFGYDEDLSRLFEDPEPETTFNDSEAHRTYIRPQKRKRRLKGDHFVMLLESDESEEEDNSAEQEKQLSRESDDMEKPAKKKRQNKISKDDVALIEFVKEFNELCKEVERHELVVEKNT